MKYTIILLLALLIVTKEDRGTFSINPFIEYLQENGYYELITDVKCLIKTDVAIEVCEILAESAHCEEVVRIYMTCPPPSSVLPPISPDSFVSLDDKLISILNSHNIPLDKFKKLIYALRNKNKIKNKNEELDVKSSKY